MFGGLDIAQGAVTGSTFVQMPDGNKLCAGHGIPDRPEAVEDGAIHHDVTKGVVYSAGGKDANGLETKTFYKLDLNKSPLEWEQVTEHA